MILKAALKSNSRSITKFPESTDNKISFYTLKRADSVMWCFLKPDWKDWKTPFESKKFNNWAETTFSRILEIKRDYKLAKNLRENLTSRLDFLTMV